MQILCFHAPKVTLIFYGLKLYSTTSCLYNNIFQGEINHFHNCLLPFSFKMSNFIKSCIDIPSIDLFFFLHYYSNRSRHCYSSLCKILMHDAFLTVTKVFIIFFIIAVELNTQSGKRVKLVIKLAKFIRIIKINDFYGQIP